MLLDAREKRVVGMESALLQRGVACETRTVSLGDMLWVARSSSDPTDERA